MGKGHEEARSQMKWSTRLQKVCFVLSPTHLSSTITIWTGGYPVKTRLSGQIPARFGAIAVYGQAKAAEAVPSITLLVKWENPTPFSSAMDLDLLIESEHVRQVEVLKFSVSGLDTESGIVAAFEEGDGWDLSFCLSQLFVLMQLLFVGYCFMQVRQGLNEAVPNFVAEPPPPKEAAQNFVADPFTQFSKLNDEIHETLKVPTAPGQESEVDRLGNAFRFEESEQPSWEQNSDRFATASEQPSRQKRLEPSLTGLEFYGSERPPEPSAQRLARVFNQ